MPFIQRSVSLFVIGITIFVPIFAQTFVPAVFGLYHREVVHEIPRRDGTPVRRAYRLNKLLVARRLVDTLRETLEEHRRGPHPVNSAELRRTLDVMLKLVHFLRRVGEQYLQPAVLWDILEFAPVSLDILKIKVPLLGVVQERNVHHVAAQNFYADIGIALCDALYDVRRAAPYLALPKELLLPEIVHRRAVVDDRRAVPPELVGDVLRH